MELLQLYYFERIAKYQSMSKAAEELHVSQPSLSSCISRLETELGARLFDRNGRKLVLNSYGRYFLNMAQQILDLVNECKMPMNENDRMETIKIGFMNYNDRMFSILSEFSRDNPDISLNIYGSTLSEPFAYSAYDFIVGRSYEMVAAFPHEITIEPLDYYVIVPKSHPLSRKNTIRLEELKNESFCFLKDEHSGFEIEYKSCVLNGFIPRCAFVTNSPFYKLRYVSQNDVFGFIPGAWKPVYEKCENIVLIPRAESIEDATVKLFWSDSTLNSDVNQRFLEYVKKKLEPESGS